MERLGENTNPFKQPKPFSIGDVVKTPDLRSVSYTSFDFYSIKERTIEYIRKYFPNDYNDFTEQSLGIMLTELWAFIGDLISFKLDMNINEVFIDTVSERKNIHRLAKFAGYPIRLPRAAVARMSLSVVSPYTFDVKIDRGTSFHVPSRDGNVLEFQLYPANEDWEPIEDEDIFIPAGLTTNLSVVAVEGGARSVDRVSDGSKFQTFETTDDNVLEDSIKVYVNGQKWSRVDFFGEHESGPYYIVEYDENFRATVIFGDDVRAIIPPPSAEIQIDYRYGGGYRGNIDVGYVQQILNVTSDLVPGSVPVSITNYTRGEGGEPAEDIDEIKTKLPLWNKAQGRCVTGEDYSFFAEKLSTTYNGRIGKAKAILRSSGCSGNIVDVYVLQADGEDSLKTVSPVLKRKLQTFLNGKKMLTDYVCIKDASQVYQNMTISIGINKFYAQYRKAVIESVNQRIKDFFRLTRWSIGQPLRKSDLINFLSSSTNIASVNIEFEDRKSVV